MVLSQSAMRRSARAVTASSPPRRASSSTAITASASYPPGRSSCADCESTKDLLGRPRPRGVAGISYSAMTPSASRTARCRRTAALVRSKRSASCRAVIGPWVEMSCTRRSRVVCATPGADSDVVTVASSRPSTDPFYNRRLAKYPPSGVRHSTKGPLTCGFIRLETGCDAALPCLPPFHYCGRHPAQRAPPTRRDPRDDHPGELHPWHVRGEGRVLRPRHELHRRPHHPRRPGRLARRG